MWGPPAVACRFGDAPRLRVVCDAREGDVPRGLWANLRWASPSAAGCSPALPGRWCNPFARQDATWPRSSSRSLSLSAPGPISQWRYVCDGRAASAMSVLRQSTQLRSIAARSRSTSPSNRSLRALAHLGVITPPVGDLLTSRCFACGSLSPRAAICVLALQPPSKAESYDVPSSRMQSVQAPVSVAPRFACVGIDG